MLFIALLNKRYQYVCDQRDTQVLLLYDHWDDTQMIFEGSYQIVMLASFFVRLINEFWNRNKVCFFLRNYDTSSSYKITLKLYISIFSNLMYFYLCCYCVCNQMIQLYQAIDDHWNIFTNDIEVQVLKDYSMLSRKFTKYYSRGYITLVIVVNKFLV